MLVLTRYANQSIHIGDSITVRVVSIDRGQVKLAIDAPADVGIWRDEVAARLRAEGLDPATRSKA